MAMGCTPKSTGQDSLFYNRLSPVQPLSLTFSLKNVDSTGSCNLEVAEGNIPPQNHLTCSHCKLMPVVPRALRSWVLSPAPCTFYTFVYMELWCSPDCTTLQPADEGCCWHFHIAGFCQLWQPKKFYLKGCSLLNLQATKLWLIIGLFPFANSEPTLSDSRVIKMGPTLEQQQQQKNHNDRSFYKRWDFQHLTEWNICFLFLNRYQHTDLGGWYGGGRQQGRKLRNERTGAPLS